MYSNIYLRNIKDIVFLKCNGIFYKLIFIIDHSEMSYMYINTTEVPKCCDMSGVLIIYIHTFRDNYVDSFHFVTFFMHHLYVW